MNRLDAIKMVEDVNKKEVNPELELIITNILKDLSIPVNILGYKYLRTAIFIASTEPDSLQGITKVLYPAVAKKHRTTASKVERGIRYSIELAWLHTYELGNEHLIRQYFGNIDDFGLKPKNGQFIATVADYISLNHFNLLQ